MSNYDPRVVRVYIEMNLVEGKDFAKSKTDQAAIQRAEESFWRFIGKIYSSNFSDYVQSRVVRNRD